MQNSSVHPHPRLVALVLTAMVTPFGTDLKLDAGRIRNLADHLLNSGTDILVASGTTGEAPTLEKDEKIQLWNILREHTKAPLIAGTGSYSTQTTIELSLAAQEAGVDGLLVVNPYYNKPDQAGLLRHFEAVANAVSIPILLYNHPGRTGVTLSTETVCQLAQHPNIAGIKDSSGNLVFLSEVKARVSPEFLIYSGDDPLTLPILAIGGQGVISVASHVAGPAIQSMVTAFHQGDLNRAREWHFKLLAIAQGLFCAPSPSPVKYALEQFGVPVGGVRLPLLDLDPSHYEFIKKLIAPFAQVAIN